MRADPHEVHHQDPCADLEKLKETAGRPSPVKDSLRAIPYTSELVVES